MDQLALQTLLEKVRDSEVTPGEAVHRLRHLPFEDLGFAKIDHHRPLRIGLPEVIYSAGKTPEQVAEIFVRMAERGTNVLATRANREKFEAVHARVPQTEFHTASGCVVLRRNNERRGHGLVLVVCAGTSDIPVAEEAAITADLMGNEVSQLCDVGVAGLHRLLAHRDILTRARVLIVCAVSARPESIAACPGLCAVPAFSLALSE